MRPAGAAAVKRRAFFGALAGVPMLGMQSERQSGRGNARPPALYVATREIAVGEDLVDFEGRVIGRASCRYWPGCTFRTEDLTVGHQWKEPM